jgi:hypothetical protein
MLQASILGNLAYFTDNEVRVFNNEYQKAFRRACNLADQNLKRMTSGRARSQHLCWDIIKRLRPSRGSVAIPAEKLIEHFSGIFFTSQEPLSFMDPLWPFSMSVEDGIFLDSELVTALVELNGQAAVGPERIPSRVIKDVFSDVRSRAPLLALMNLCFRQGVVPVDWGTSEIFVLYKMKGSRDDPNNYRGINLINDFCKVYERLIEKRFQSWMSRTTPQGPMQFGFRKGTATTEAYFSLATVGKYFTRVLNIPCFSCFVDLKKAFPSVLRSSVLEALMKKGAPPDSVRALASIFSFNSCRLRVNSFLSRSFPINRGVKEGGINSPSAFIVLYALVLERLNIHPLPSNLSTLDPEKVYYFVYADDLSFLSCNLSRVNDSLNQLHSILPDYGMSMNAAKTCWMPFFPTSSRYRVDLPSPFGLQVDDTWIECVDKVPYLGYIMNIFLGNNDHLAKKRDLMFGAARSSGKLLRHLEITNLNSIRTFFFSFVASQQYGVSIMNFQSLDFMKAAKIFLTTSFCLPDSFPYAAVAGVLRLHGFELTALQHRLAFIKRGFREGSLIAKVLDFDQNVLQNHQVGLLHDLIQFLGQFFDVSDLSDLDIRDFSYLQDLRDQLVIQLENRHFLEFARSTGLNYWTSLAEDAFLPQGFCNHFGSLDLESARVVLLFLGDVFRFSLGATGSQCPLCPSQLHSSHLFLCPNCPFANELPPWSSVINYFRSNDWKSFVMMLFIVLRIWATQTNFFSENAKRNINRFFD